MTAEQPDDPETTELDTSKLRKPNEDPSQETTPIGDALDPSKRKPAETEDDDDAEEDDAEDEGSDEVPFSAKAYKVDVERALERETFDGKGDEDVPESDFVSYATDDVEVKED